MITLIRSLVLALLAFALLSTQQLAHAQAEINLPPRQDTKSGTGVSFKTGTFSLEGTTDLSIGGDGTAGLRLVRSYSSSNSGALAEYTQAQGWTFNTVATIARNKRTYAPDEEPPPNPQFIPLIYTVTTGNKSTAFISGRAFVPANPFSPLSPGGETLVFTKIGSGAMGSGSYFTFTDSDGSVYLYPWLATTRLQSATFADGTRWEYTYVAAPTGLVTRAVFSNRGYAILFESQTKACIVNLAETYVTPTSLCPASAQTVTYSYTTGIFNPNTQNLTGATNVLGQTTTYSYVGADHLGCVKEPGQSTCKISNTYDVCIAPPSPPTPPPTLRYSDKVISQTTGSGETYSFAYQFIGAYEYCTDYTGYGAVTAMTAPGGAVTTVGTNGAGMPAGISDPLNRLTTVLYDEATVLSWEAAIPERETAPEGNYQRVTRDARANITEKRIVAKAGSGFADLAITASYPASCPNPKTCNKPAYIIDARGNRTDFTYDPTHGGVLTETRPAAPNGVRPQKRYTYTQLYAWIKNSSGGFVQASTPVWMLTSTSECMTLASCAGSADEIKTTYTYGSTGVANNLHVTAVTVAAGNNSVAATTTTAYDSAGNAISVDGPLAGSDDTTRTRYDALRRVVGVISPDPDGGGPLLHRAVRNTYDASGGLIKVERGTVNSQSDVHWAAFSPLETTDFVYDIMGRKTKESKSAGGTTYTVSQFNYDGSGRLKCTAVRMDPAQWNSQTDACVPQTSGAQGPDRISQNFYNLAGERTTLRLGVGTAVEADEETSTFTGNGKLWTITDGEGNRTTYTYDGHDRLQKTNYPHLTTDGVSSSTDYEQLAFDANSNITQRRLRDGQLINYSYDNLNRMSLKDLPAPEADVAYSAYDLQGHLTSASNGISISASWDALGRQRVEYGPHGPMQYDYDAAGRRIRTTWPDGVFVTHEHYTTGEVREIRELGNPSSATVLANYFFDNRGNRVQTNFGSGAYSIYTPDAVSRLSTMSTNLPGDSHDLYVTLTYNPANQIATFARGNDVYAWAGHFNRNHAYTINGLNQATTAGPKSLGYDGRGNVTSIGTDSYTYSVENRMLTGPGGTTLQYDPLGRLYQISRAGLTTRFQYDGTDLVAEYTDSNALEHRYVHGPGADEPVLWYSGSGLGDRRYYHQDERGSVVAITNGAAAAIAIKTYDEYGVLGGASHMGRFAYTGQTWLPEVGLYYYKARMYVPMLGRFMQSDSIGYGDGLNLYAYVGNDPVNNEDPTGNCPICVKAVVDFGIELAIQYVTTGEVDIAAAAIETGKGLVNPAKTLQRIAKLGSAAKKTYTTYKRKNATTGKVYGGKTSGKGTPEQQVAKRTQSADHKQKTAEGYGPAEVDKNSSNEAAIRGREQQIIKENGGAQSEGGTSGNKINSVSPGNSNAEAYAEACNKEFGCGG